MVKKHYKEIDKITRDRFMEKLTLEKTKDFEQIACINDILLLGRIIGKTEKGKIKFIKFSEEMEDLKNSMVSSLAIRRPGRDLCHMSPRKPNKLLPIILADTLLLPLEELRSNYGRDRKNERDFALELKTERILHHIEIENTTPTVTRKNLRVFYHIWDFEGDRDRLMDEVDVLLGE